MLRNIIDEPERDDVRLIYADWLDEHGDGGRAEFIRAQCALARPWSEEAGECWQCHARRTGGQHTNGPCRCTPAWRVLCRRERELLTPARFWEWFGGLVASAWPGTPLVHALPGPACEVSYSSRPWVNEGRDVWTLATRRGFVQSVTLPCADWLAHGPALVRAAPLTRVVLADVEPHHTHVVVDGREVWCWWKTGHAAPLHALPPELWRALVPPWGDYAVPWDRIDVKDFPSEEAALDALSEVCLRWARAAESIPAG